MTIYFSLLEILQHLQYLYYTVLLENIWLVSQAQVSFFSNTKGDVKISENPGIGI